jgi:hypothetical protein
LATADITTSAPPDVQVAALNQTSQVVVGVVLTAFLLSLWALFQEQKLRSASKATG